MYIFINLSGIETATGRMSLYLYQYDYINIALGACIEIATRLISFIISGTVMPLGVYNETPTGRMGSYF